jgi:hypothetical protein
MCGDAQLECAGRKAYRLCSPLSMKCLGRAITHLGRATGALARSSRSSFQFTLKTCLLVAEPSGVVTLIFPVLALLGTIAVI